MVRAISGIALMGLAGILVAYLMVYQWANPDLTDRRVFLNNWELCLAMPLALMSGAWLVRGAK